MFIEPGIFDLAHSKGIKFIEDVNGDGRIDRQDLTIALKQKAGASLNEASKVNQGTVTK
jgi:hypothetical protein